jgi:hypothetical protein
LNFLNDELFLRPSPEFANNYFDRFFHALMRTHAKWPGCPAFSLAIPAKMSERLVRLMRIA